MNQELPSVESLQKEYDRIMYRKKFKLTVQSTFNILILTCASVVLISLLFIPVFKIYGSSMTPALTNGEYVAAIKQGNFETGDIVAFYFNNKLLVKRVIGKPGDWINIDEDGNIYVNDILLEEPYIDEKAFGECDIVLPIQVPESRYFLVGDHRNVSIDSRNKMVGFVAEEQIVGKLFFKLYPFDSIGWIE